MDQDRRRLYSALAARDARFDGVFFVGVASTGIYCRPVCPARTPRRENCAFYPNAAAAQGAGYRPCRRCRPELPAGGAPVDAVGRLAAAALRGVEAVAGERYVRTVALGGGRGWMAVGPAAGRDALRVEVAASLAPALLPLAARVKRLFDLGARPGPIAAQLGPLAAARPGLRVP